jgi:hypothetical protein
MLRKHAVASYRSEFNDFNKNDKSMKNSLDFVDLAIYLYHANSRLHQTRNPFKILAQFGRLLSLDELSLLVAQAILPG